MLVKLFSYLPLRVLYVFSSIIYVIMYYLIGYRRAVVRENIDQAFPEKPIEERSRIIKDFYKNLSEFMVETLKAFSISSDEIKRRVTFKNSHLVEQYFKQEQSVLILTSHQFNWEWLLLASCLELSAPLNPVYKLLNNPYFDDLMYKMRSRFGSTPIEMQNTLMEIMKRRKQLNGFGLVADQIPLADAEKYWTKFLGIDTAFFLGPEKIAFMTNYPVLFAAMRKINRGYYQVEFIPLAEPPYDSTAHTILEAYANQCEKILLEQPASWLWSHRRWKHKKPLYED